jgi:hypothetical protein
MASGRPSLGEVVVKTMVIHTITYFIIGFAAFASFGYAHKFAEPDIRSLMRQTDEPLVMAGPALAELQELHLKGTKVTEAGIRELQKAHPKVKVER